MLPATRCVGHNTDLNNKLSTDIQVNRLCTFGSLVSNVQSFWSYWNLKNSTFSIIPGLKGLKTAINKTKHKSACNSAITITFHFFIYVDIPFHKK